MTDYSDPLLAMKQMLKQYEQMLLNREWQQALEMAPMLMTQMRLLTQTVRVQIQIDEEMNRGK